MPRDGKPARRRLSEAALKLFETNGFDGTTAAQIAAHAGVTERTFFRHFADKREVLFDGQTLLNDALASAIREAPISMSPLETIRSAFSLVSDRLEQNRSFSEPRQRIIASTPALREREIAKHSALTTTVTEALLERDVETRKAELAAKVGVAALSYAFSAWFAARGSALADHLDEAFAELRGLSTDRL